MTKTWLKFSQKGQTQCCRRLVYNFGFSANTFERLMFHTSYLAQTTWYFKIAAKTTGRWATLQPVCLYQTLGMIVYSMFHYHHRLCGSASPMLTATDFVIGKGQFSTPTVSTPSTDHQTICHKWLCRRPLQLCKLSGNSSTAGVWAHGWNITKIIILFIPPFWGTHLQVRFVDGFSRTIAQTTRTRANICRFVGFVHKAPPFGGQKPQNPQLWGVNRCFQAKLPKSKNVHIIKTTASIPTKFCTVTKTSK